MPDLAPLVNQSPDIKDADGRAAATEVLHLMNPLYQGGEHAPYDDVKLLWGWAPVMAGEMFLRRYVELTNDHAAMDRWRRLHKNEVRT